MLQHLSKLIVASALVLAVSPAIAADSLRIGVVPGAYADSINAAAQDAKAQQNHTQRRQDGFGGAQVDRLVQQLAGARVAQAGELGAQGLG